MRPILPQRPGKWPWEKSGEPTKLSGIPLHFYRVCLLSASNETDSFLLVTLASPNPIHGELAAAMARQPTKPTATGRVVWLFGRSGSGKTTLAAGLAATFNAAGIAAVHLDGSAIRARLSADLGFSDRDRAENHRRIAEVAKILVDQGITVVASSMAPLRVHRDVARTVLKDSVTWIHLHASVETCTQRDPKGLYQMAREGRVPDFLDFPFEAPDADETVWNHCTEGTPPEASLRRLWNLVDCRSR